MNTSIDHLSVIRRDQLRLIIQIIKNSVSVDKIFLYGIHASDAGGRDWLSDPSFPTSLSTYDLLVIVPWIKHRFDYEIQDMLENRCRRQAEVTILVHDIGFINRQLSEGDYFFDKIQREGILLHDARLSRLIEGPVPDLCSLKEKAQRQFDKFWHFSQAFFKSALYNSQHKECKVAVFLLHQAAENIYHAILAVFSGYKWRTHNLSKLQKYTNRFSVELAMLFPQNTSEENSLFKLLMNGYVDARYDEAYTIAYEDLELLIQRVRKLIFVAERICKNRFLSLNKHLDAV